MALPEEKAPVVLSPERHHRPVVELLSWDTEFFGFPVAQIGQNRVDEHDMAETMAFCRAHKIRLVQFKCDAHHQPSVRLAERNGFHFADARVTFRRSLDGSERRPALPEDVSFRLGRHGDIAQLRSIVTDLYRHSRYYFDPEFPRDRVRVFYSDWIEKAVRGTFDDLAWVLCVADHPVAFCTATHGEEGRSYIGLVGVSREFAGRRLGSLMMDESMFEFAKAGAKVVEVVTQGRNYSAQRLYQRSGFVTHRIEIYYHRWF